MIDRGRSALRQSEDRFEIEPSSLHWEEGKLIIEIDEISGPPIISRVSVRITLTPSPKKVRNMLGAPFYSRSAVKTKINGMETVGVHRALDLVQSRNPLIKPMLAMRVPRHVNWKFD